MRFRLNLQTVSTVQSCRLQSVLCTLSSPVYDIYLYLYIYIHTHTYIYIYKFPRPVSQTSHHTRQYCPLLQARRRPRCPSSCTSTANLTSGTPATRTMAACWLATDRSWSSPSTFVSACLVSSAAEGSVCRPTTRFNIHNS